jgi:hypothetical protein
MVKLSIELPDTMTVAMRNGASVTVNVTDISGLAAELLAYGIGQKLRDSASAASTIAKETGEDVQGVAQGMLDKALASLVAGEWSHRGDGAGTDPRVLVARSVTRQAMKAALGSKSPEWAKFTGLSDADQLAKLDETYAANEAVLSDAVDKEVARRAEANKAKAKLAKAMTVSI